MKFLMKCALHFLAIVLLFSAPNLKAQSETESPKAVSGFLKIKTNPFQYVFRRANLSVELDLKPQTSIELKAEVFPPVPSLYAYPLSNFSAWGRGFGGHLMVRRYNAKHHWFLAGGLSLKNWSYDSLKFDPGSFAGSWETECSYQSVVTWIPGLKVLGGIQYNIPRAPITIEAFAGTGVKFRFTETDVHSSGLASNNCQISGTSSVPVGKSTSLNIMGAIYLGGNIGFDLFRN